MDMACHCQSKQVGKLDSTSAVNASVPLLAEQMLTDVQLKMIGCLAFESAFVESLLEQLIDSQAGTVVAQLLLSNKMLTAKLDILKGLVVPAIIDVEPDHDRDGSLRKKFEDLCAKIASDIARRNTVIHGEWNHGEKLDASKIRTLADFLSKRHENSFARRKFGNPVKASEVMDLAREFQSHVGELVMHWSEYRRLQAASRGRSDG